MVQGYVNVKMAKRLLQFDSIFESIVQVLVDYGVDLRKVLSGGFLQDHPDIVAFHKRNLKALTEIETIVKDLEQVKPRQKEVTKGNHPIWE